MSVLNEVINQFAFKGELENCEIFGSGHINTTYLATYNDGDEKCKYIIQKVNTGIFKDIDKLMDNVFAVTSYLRGEIKKNGGDENRETLHFIKTKNGDKYYRTENGDCYRAYVFVSDSISYNSVDSPELFKQSGIAFDLKIADIARDGQLLQYVREVAQTVVDADPHGMLPENEVLWRQLKALRKTNVNWAAIS